MVCCPLGGSEKRLMSMKSPEGGGISKWELAKAERL